MMVIYVYGFQSGSQMHKSMTYDYIRRKIRRQLFLSIKLEEEVRNSMVMHLLIEF